MNCLFCQVKNPKKKGMLFIPLLSAAKRDKCDRQKSRDGEDTLKSRLRFSFRLASFSAG
jgi:hypothetical protein